jgi:hypothetical protein
MNLTRVPVYSAHIGGASVQDLAHFAQVAASKNFPMYDYGSSQENMAHYNQTTPPLYDMTKVTVPTALFYGDHDGYADPADVMRLSNVLPNVVYSLETPAWEHMDFVWGMDAYKLVYPSVLQIMNKY